MVALGLLAPALALPWAAHADSAEPLHDLVDTAAQRLQTADPVAASKWLTGAPITDTARAAQVLARVTHDAESLGVPTDFATAVFTDQINATEGVQYARFSWWKFDPAAAPATAPDLADSRALIDGLTARMLAEIAEQWPLLRSPGCAAALDGARGEVAAARGLDPLYRQALDAATRSYCG